MFLAKKMNEEEVVLTRRMAFTFLEKKSLLSNIFEKTQKIETKSKYFPISCLNDNFPIRKADFVVI